jgi:hypothetical protein
LCALEKKRKRETDKERYRREKEWKKPYPLILPASALWLLVLIKLGLVTKLVSSRKTYSRRVTVLLKLEISFVMILN